ncbi:MAG: hypothetical protein OCD00_11080 [Colwellia sp.]
MNTIITICTAIFLLLIGIIIRQAIKIGTLESSLKNEDKSINSLRAKLDVAEQEHKESISNLKEVHSKEVELLNDKIHKSKPPRVKRKFVSIY